MVVPPILRGRARMSNRASNPGSGNPPFMRPNSITWARISTLPGPWIRHLAVAARVPDRRGPRLPAGFWSRPVVSPTDPVLW